MPPTGQNPPYGLWGRLIVSAPPVRCFPTLTPLSVFWIHYLLSVAMPAPSCARGLANAVPSSSSLFPFSSFEVPLPYFILSLET